MGMTTEGMRRAPVPIEPWPGEVPGGNVESPPKTWPAWADDVVELGRSPGLTGQQVAVLAAIRESLATRRRPPTVREIGESVGISSPNGVVSHLDRLVRKGWIVRKAMLSRAIQIIHRRERAAAILARTESIACQIDPDGSLAARFAGRDDARRAAS